MEGDRTWIQTFTGKKFYPLDPDSELICIEDIAHSLANQCRYAGHTREFYSVARHSRLLSDRFLPKYPIAAFYALLHDASEAYLSDIPGPLKERPEFDFYRNAEARLQRLIFHRFNLSSVAPEVVQQADHRIVHDEAQRFMSPLHPDWPAKEGTGALAGYYGWSPAIAEHRFIRRFEILSGWMKGKRWQGLR